MKLMNVGVYRYPMGSPADVTELEKLIDSGEVKADEIVALIAQTEGDGYSRGYSTMAYQNMLSKKLGITQQEVFDRIPMLMIGLTGGLMSPHATVFTRNYVEGNENKEKRLVIGVKDTRVLLPEEYGTTVHVLEVAKVVKEAMQEAGIEDVKDVHCVEVKCPNLTPQRIEDAQRRGQKLITTNLAAAGDRSKGASALGVALGLGEIEEKDVNDGAICSNWDLYSNVASTSAGAEQVASRILVIGNSKKSVSKFKIGSGVMEDTLDIKGALDALRGAGLEFDTLPDEKECKKLATLFVNAGANALPTIRGRRHTMHSDYLAAYAGVFAKAVVNAIIGAIVGDTMILASAGFEHQGKRGANLVAAIGKVDE
jgi:cyanuric acid amidohydrolase